MQPDKFERYKRVREDYFASEGMRIHTRMEQLNVSYSVFCGNCNELMTALNGYRDPAVSIRLGAMDNRDELLRVLDEIVRLLLNCTASAQSLTDHSRRMIRDLYAEDAFSQECQDRIDKMFACSPVAKFIQDFRNHILHVSVPSIFLHNRVKSGSYEAWIGLDRDHLLEWDGWTSKSREYLENGPSSVDLRVPLQDYCFLVLEFQNWLQARQHQLHETAFARMKALLEEGTKLELQDSEP